MAQLLILKRLWRGSIICKLSADNVQESPVYSNSISYDVTPARNILEFEAYTNDNKYKSSNSSLFFELVLLINNSCW